MAPAGGQDHESPQDADKDASAALALRNLVARGNLTKRDLDELMASLPDSIALQRQVLPIYKSIRAFDRFEQITDRVLARDPDDVATRLALVHILVTRHATVLIDRHALDVAREHLALAKAARVVTDRNWFDIAWLHSLLGDQPSALDAARRASELAQGAFKGYAALRFAEFSAVAGDKTTARQALHEILPELVAVDQLAKAGMIFAELGMGRHASQLADRALSSLSSKTHKADAYLGVARLFAKIDEPQKACQALRQVELPPVTDLGTLRALHMICFELQINDLALFYAEAVLEREPEDPTMTQRAVLLRLWSKAAAPPRPGHQPAIDAPAAGTHGIAQVWRHIQGHLTRRRTASRPEKR